MQADSKFVHHRSISERESAQVYLGKHPQPRKVPPPLPLVCAHPLFAVVQDTRRQSGENK